MTYTDTKDDEVKEAYSYTYDKNSNIIKEHIISNYVASDGKGIDSTREYEYDENGRLVLVDVNDGTERKHTAYTYDGAGNRLSKTTDDEVTEYTYNGLDQLISSSTKAEGKKTEDKRYTYDRNGNQISEIDNLSGQSVQMDYDAANRLVSYIAKQDGNVLLTQDNVYNGEGQRIRKTGTKNGDTNTRNYYYQNGTVLYTTDELGKENSFNIIGDDDRVIATSREGNGKWYLYNKDCRGSTSSIIDEDGVLTASYDYDEFGNTTVRAGENFDNEICYTGQIYDLSTGLYYYNARFYNPEEGRFLTQDTYRGESTEPETWHLYAYCANDPVNNIDPSGHDAIVLKSRFATRAIGHMALLVQDSENKWRYFSWADKGYNSPYMGDDANKGEKKSVKKGKVYNEINTIFDRDTPSKKYRKYLYLKGDFSKCMNRINDIKHGKSYKKYNLLTVNCAWMAIHVLKAKYKKGEKKYKELNNMQWRTIRHRGQKIRRKRTIIPSIAFNQLKKMYGVSTKNVIE